MSLPKSMVSNIGIEVEIATLDEGTLRNLIYDNPKLGRWHTHSDASIYTSRYLSALLPFSVEKFDCKTRSPILHEYKSGIELVSPIIDVEDDPEWGDQIKVLFDKLQKAKELPTKETSLHVHVNSSGIPLFAIKNLINLWQGLEAVIYRLSIAELGFHRGAKRRDYLYCRPLSSPQVIMGNGGKYRYSYSVDALMKARNPREFFLAYGNTQISSDPNKYSPPRYSALNFHSLNSYGSIEFRTFNMTTNPNNVFAWVDLCQSMIKQSMGKPVEIEQRPLGWKGNFNIANLQTILEFDDATALKLEHLWNNSEWCDKVAAPILTHSSQNSILWEKVKPELIPPEVTEKIRKYKTDDEFIEIDPNSTKSKIPTLDYDFSSAVFRPERLTARENITIDFDNYNEAQRQFLIDAGYRLIDSNEQDEEEHSEEEE